MLRSKTILEDDSCHKNTNLDATLKAKNVNIDEELVIISWRKRFRILNDSSSDSETEELVVSEKNNEYIDERISKCREKKIMNTK